MSMTYSFAIEVLKVAEENPLEDSLTEVLTTICALFAPSFGVGQGLFRASGNQFRNIGMQELGLCVPGETDCIRDSMIWEVAGKQVSMMILAACAWWSLCLLIEINFFAPQVQARFHKPQQSNGSCLRFINLGRRFWQMTGTVEAVSGINLELERGEIFCLIGPNGAGKTTTLRLIAGDLLPSYGDAQVLGHSIRKSINTVRRHLGFCPQNDDALPARLTVKETIKNYARLRGLPESALDGCVERLSKQLCFEPYLEVWSSKLSGGNRRKLAMAVALVGEPQLLLLDEPTTGIDTSARRGLWAAARDLAELGKTILLASHSLEECEALSDRYCVMSEGQLQSVRTPRELWQSHSGAYMLVIWKHPEAEDDAMARISHFVQDALPSPRALEEQTAGALCWEFFPSATCTLASLFQLLVEATTVGRLLGAVEDYEVSQVPLERACGHLFHQRQIEVQASIE